MNSRKMAHILGCIIVLSSVWVVTKAADEDPLQDFCVADLKSHTTVNGFACKDPSMVSATDFLFQGLAKAGNTTGSVFGSVVTPGNVQTFPGLNTLGISMNRVDFAVGGVNPLHSHPRATEIIFLNKGSILVGFVTTNNTLFTKTLEEGDVFVVPRGMVHFQKNVGHENAMTITAFNSQFPGAVVLPFTLFRTDPPFPEDVLEKSFQINKETLHDILDKF